MDFKINREKIVCPVCLLETEVTQTAEHDFILPDYCPDIFRVLKCCMIPCVVSTAINGSRLTFDVNITIRALYKSSDSSGVHCIEQSLDYSKTVDLPSDAVDPSVSVTPSAESVNCRVVNQRRLDVRGSAVFKVRVTGVKSCEAVCDAFGGGIQLKKQPVLYPAKRLVCAKRITVIEELELAAGKPPFGSVLRCGTGVRKGEQRIIPGKLITKGDAEIDLLYQPSDSAGKPPESMKFTIPFSQIIDIEGIEDDFESSVEITPSKCVVSVKAEEGGVLECELVLLVNIEAVKYDTCELVTDAYSTKYECECEPFAAEPALPPTRCERQIAAQTSLSCSDGEIAQVYDLWCAEPTISARYDDSHECIMLFGKVNFCMLGKLADGSSAYAEKECVFEQPLNSSDEKYEDTKVSANVRICGCSYTLSEDGTVQAKAELSAEAVCRKNAVPKLLGNITLMTDKPKECDKRCAVKICYSESGSSLWDIAKKYSTSAAALAEENPTDDKDGRRVLIIPIKN